ncbi:MAG: hypothetical protein LBF22_07095 [Deltaproteobacteria bacterium]|jgi:hypothetical protein|nr:hypothetical protein [Deltaproteobacteria bacterium]
MNDFKVEGHIFEEINPDSVTETDIVAGIFTYNDKTDLPLAMLKTSGGIERYYPDLKGVLINLDSHSEDGTRELFLETPTSIPKIYLSTSPDEKFKKFSFFNLINIAHRLNAKVVLFFEARITTIKKTWVPRLADPILKNGAILTSPIYSRQFFDMPTTFLLSYPMFRAVFGRRVRCPHLGDMAISQTLNERLFHNIWPKENGYPACELATLALAVSTGPVYQSFMADPRVGKNRLPINIGMAEEFFQILHSFYELMIQYESFWIKLKNSRPTPIMGTDLKPEILPPRELIDSPTAFQSAIQNGAKEAVDIWKEFFPNHLELIESLKSASLDHLDVPLKEWVELIYLGAAAYKRLPEEDGKKLIYSLVSPFLVRLFNFKKLASTLPSGQLSALLEGDAMVFEKMKPLLVNAWTK